MRIRAIREYTAQHTCQHTPPLTTTNYVVTFALENGIVIAECSFSSMDEADVVVNAVNEKYDNEGVPMSHNSTWIED